MVLLSLVWFCVISAASLALPGYQGTISTAPLVPLYAVLAVATALLVRDRAGSVSAALRSALPAGVTLVAALVAGLLQNQGLADARGEPLYLYVAIALWVSWAILLVVSATLRRANWSGAGGITLTVFVAALGWFLFSAHLD